MKIKEFAIIRYGPLNGTGKVCLGDLNLFFGKNECGKTLTVDAIVKLLLKSTKDFKDIERVEEKPEGYLIIENEDGVEKKLPETGTLDSVTELTRRDCRNIFIIRDSDLSISGEGKFYTEISDNLTGLRTHEISMAREKLNKLGRLTPTGNFMDVGDEKLKTRVEDAGVLIRNIEDIVLEARSRGLDGLEEKFERYGDRIREVKTGIEILERAGRGQKFRNGKKALENLKGVLDEFEELKVFTRDDELVWRDAERDLHDSIERREELRSKLDDLEKISGEMKGSLLKKKKDIEILRSRKEKLEREVVNYLREYRSESIRLSSRELKGRFFLPACIVSVILLGISAVGCVVVNSAFFIALTLLFLFSSMVMGIFSFQLVMDRARVQELFKKIESGMAAAGFETDPSGDMEKRVQEFERSYSGSEKELISIEKEYEMLSGRIAGIRAKEIPGVEGKMKNADEGIDRVRQASGAADFQEYVEKLKLKAEKEREKDRCASMLEAGFGSGNGGQEEKLLYWENEISALKEYEDDDVDYNERELALLKNELKELEKKRNFVLEEMEEFQEKLADTGRRASRILKNDYLNYDTVAELEAAAGNLGKFVDDNKKLREDVLRILKMLEEIEKEELEKVCELFGKKSSASEYFNEVTGGLYEEVNFSRESGEIKVRRKDGVVLPARKLSGGAYDQLYLSIRLALGERLLKGGKGFFIMDDPFIKADPDRLKELVSLLKKISDNGWQVIYFSAKGEIVDAFKDDIESGRIHYAEIPALRLE